MIAGGILTSKFQLVRIVYLYVIKGRPNKLCQVWGFYPSCPRTSGFLSTYIQCRPFGGQLGKYVLILIVPHNFSSAHLSKWKVKMYKVVRGVVRGTADAAHIVMNFPNVLKKIVISILGEGSSIFMHQYFYEISIRFL